MSMQLSTFQTFPVGRQGRKSPLNVLEKLFNQHTMVAVKNNANSVLVFSFFIPKKEVLKNDSCIDMSFLLKICKYKVLEFLFKVLFTVKFQSKVDDGCGIRNSISKLALEPAFPIHSFDCLW